MVSAGSDLFILGVVSMDYDWLGSNWYMADIINFRVFVCNRMFEHCITLAGNRIEKPSGIAVDPIDGYIFCRSFDLSLKVLHTVWNLC